MWPPNCDVDPAVVTLQKYQLRQQSVIMRALYGRSVKPPWLNIRSTAELDAGTLRARSEQLVQHSAVVFPG